LGAAALRFLAPLVEVLAPELSAAAPNDSAPGALVEIGTAGIRDSGASSTPGT
jgi:hypothetical protein